MDSLKISFPVMNASGVLCTTEQELIDLAKSETGAVVIKSMSILPREGNPHPRLKISLDLNPKSSINSMGLPNLGYKRYAEFITELKKYNKPIISSLAAAPCDLNTVEQYKEMVRTLEKVSDMIELNLSCPNLEKKSIIAYKPEMIEEILTVAKPKIPWSIKLPPYNFDLELFTHVADTIAKFKPDAISTINSNPNCLDIDIKTKKKLIKPNKGFGGLGGDAVLYQALGEVNRWHNYFKEKNLKIKVKGCGGIVNTESAIKHFMCGASYIQLGTWYLQQGPRVFEQLKQELNNWLKNNNYNSISDIVGIVSEH